MYGIELIRINSIELKKAINFIYYTNGINYACLYNTAIIHNCVDYVAYNAGALLFILQFIRFLLFI